MLSSTLTSLSQKQGKAYVYILEIRPRKKGWNARSSDKKLVNAIPPNADHLKKILEFQSENGMQQ